MDILDLKQLFRDFPRLNRMPHPFECTSGPDIKYNCIAWATNVNDQWWDPYNVWPKECPRQVTIPAFVCLFDTLGYEKCDLGRREVGYEKIVLYVMNNKPTHVARQLKNGRWTSKLGKGADIEHRVKDLEGPCYGRAAMYFHRPIQNS